MPSKDHPQKTTELVEKLTKIRERLFWLHAVYACSLSRDVLAEAETYRRLFREVGEELRAIDQDAYQRLVDGHEAVLLAEPTQTKPTLPLDVQQFIELRASLPLLRRKPERDVGYVPDGLQGFL